MGIEARRQNVTYVSGTSAAGRRTIVPPRRSRLTELPEGGMGGALRASVRLEKLARTCGDGLAERDSNGVRRAIGLALDAIEAIEAGLATEFPPNDPGQPPEPLPARRGLASIGPGQRAPTAAGRQIESLKLPHPNPLPRGEGNRGWSLASR